MVRLMKEIVSRGLHDIEFLRSSVENFDQFLSALKTEEVETREDVRDAARLMGAERKLVFLLGPMVARSANGYELSRLVANLAFLCGQPESVFFLFQGCNELGAWEMGCAPDRLPGDLSLEDTSATELLRNVWEADVDVQRGLDALGMIRAAEAGDVKALVLLGVDPFAIFPDSERTRNALGGLDLLVRTTMFTPREGETAEIVFPSTAITEADGTYINTEGRVQRVSKIVDPPGTARPNARFLIDLAGKLGPAMGFLTAKDVFEEIRAICPKWRNLSWVDLGRPGGVSLWNGDGRDGEQSGTPQFAAFLPDSRPSNSEAPPERPWKVIPEERTVQPGDGIVSGRSYRLARFTQDDVARMNRVDASTIGAKSGSSLVLRSDVGEVKVRLVVDPEVPPSGIVVPSGGPGYMLQRLISWPKEEDALWVGTVSLCPLSWRRSDGARV